MVQLIIAFLGVSIGEKYLELLKFRCSVTEVLCQGVRGRETWGIDEELGC